MQKWMVFDKQTILFDVLASSAPCFFSAERVKPFLNENTRVFSFQMESGIIFSCFFYDGEIIPDREQYVWLPLRDAFDQVDANLVPQIIKAYGGLQWHQSQRFCSQCGTALLLQKNPFEKYCAECDNFFYPVISPSVIVRIKRDDEILLARLPRFKKETYGLIAGFVEIGETLEQAVHREVKEETNLRITNLIYFGSQFWPFPHSFMVGFTADYASGELIINREELEDAAWFPRSRLPNLPTSKSISYQLIDDFRKGENSEV